MSIPGLITLMGSGETAPSGRVLHEWALRKLDPPVNVSIMETPAGFELNSSYVAHRVSDFIEHRLQNFRPEISVIPARRNESELGTNNLEVLRPLLSADYIFMGPGSPSYTVRHLEGSLAWDMIRARHRLGACLGFSSSGAIAIGESAVPTYEIYKVGEDPHWIPGLDLLGSFGLRIACVTHWNNTEGGAHLDTSRCFIGKPRMASLLSALPEEISVVGIDEHTALMLDFSEKSFHVVGKGHVTVVRKGEERVFDTDGPFAMDELGTLSLPEPSAGIRPDVWEEVVAAQEVDESPLPVQVGELIGEREEARKQKDWARSDVLRNKLLALGYAVTDTPDGPKWEVA